MRCFVLLSVAFLVPACATVVAGSSQDLTVVSNETGASCDVKRGDKMLGQVAATPATLEVSKSRKDIAVTCAKDGFQEATTTLEADAIAVAVGTVGNLLIAGGPIGVAVDAASEVGPLGGTFGAE